MLVLNAPASLQDALHAEQIQAFVYIMWTLSKKLFAEVCVAGGELLCVSLQSLATKRRPYPTSQSSHKEGSDGSKCFFDAIF